MKALRDRPIRQKLTLILVLISSAVLSLACGALFGFQAWSIQRNFTNELSVMGAIVANNVAVAAMFRDEDRAEQTLAGLAAMPSILRASLNLADGSQLTSFSRGANEKSVDFAPLKAGLHIEGSRVVLAQPVVRDGQAHGMLYVQADFRALYGDLLKFYGGILALVLTSSLLLAYLLSSRFQGFVTAPILRLTATARRIAEGKDFSMRAEASGDDEVGVLTAAFNQMLAQIQSQDSALQGVQNELRERLESLQREILERKRAQAAQAQLGAIIAGTSDFVGSSDPGGRVSYLNPAARRMVGLDEEAEISALHFSVFHPAWATPVIANEGIPAAIAHGFWAGETALLHRDGREIHVSQVLIAHKNEAGVLEQLSTIMRDISERKAAEEALRISQQKLLETSRRAGMAEVATGVLHNVGNVLNSVNVSAGVIADSVRASRVAQLVQVVSLVRGQEGTLAEFLTSDGRGRLVPELLERLAQDLLREHATLASESLTLVSHVGHIRDIVAMQQNLATVSGVSEKLSVAELVEDAFKIQAAALSRHGIVVEREYEAVPAVIVDRHKTLQILVNLIRNAKQAMGLLPGRVGRLVLGIRPCGEGHVKITVRDNGVGIAREDLARIFGLGFTTRKDGHGFGLHSSALAAREMGAILSADSEGPGSGALFTLELPLADTLPSEPLSPPAS